MRNLRVDEHQLLDASAVHERQAAREGATGVLRQHAVALQPQLIHERLQRVPLAGEAEVGCIRPLRLAHAGKVRHVARVALGQFRQHLAPGEAGQRKAVHQQQWRAATEAAQGEACRARIHLLRRCVEEEPRGRFSHNSPVDPNQRNGPALGVRGPPYVRPAGSGSRVKTTLSNSAHSSHGGWTDITRPLGNPGWFRCPPRASRGNRTACHSKAISRFNPHRPRPSGYAVKFSPVYPLSGRRHVCHYCMRRFGRTADQTLWVSAPPTLRRVGLCWSWSWSALTCWSALVWGAPCFRRHTRRRSARGRPSLFPKGPSQWRSRR